MYFILYFILYYILYYILYSILYYIPYCTIYCTIYLSRGLYWRTFIKNTIKLWTKIFHKRLVVASRAPLEGLAVLHVSDMVYTVPIYCTIYLSRGLYREHFIKNIIKLSIKIRHKRFKVVSRESPDRLDHFTSRNYENALRNTIYFYNCYYYYPS